MSDYWRVVWMCGTCVMGVCGDACVRMDVCVMDVCGTCVMDVCDPCICVCRGWVGCGVL